jgi:hypothetical protein
MSQAMWSSGPTYPRLRSRRWLLTAGGASVVLIVSYLLAVWTARGQALENAALRGADQVGSNDFTAASEALGQITVYSLALAVVLVVQLQWRGLAALMLLFWAVGIGAYTTTAKWHRFSDTVGADAVALICACLASWWLTRRGSVNFASGPVRRGRAILAGLLTLSTALLLVLGGILWRVPLLQGWDVAVPDPTQDYTAYLGAHALAAGSSGLTALIFWRLWHRLDTTRTNTPERTRPNEHARTNIRH